MKRRTFLQFLGLAPAAPIASKLPSPAVAAPVAAAFESVVPDIACVTCTATMTYFAWPQDRKFRFTDLDSLE